jgi:hypothetical protein
MAEALLLEVSPDGGADQSAVPRDVDLGAAFDHAWCLY